MTISDAMASLAHLPVDRKQSGFVTMLQLAVTFGMVRA